MVDADAALAARVPDLSICCPFVPVFVAVGARLVASESLSAGNEDAVSVVIQDVIEFTVI